jgi:sarcosine oxidase, subunit alpha
VGALLERVLPAETPALRYDQDVIVPAGASDTVSIALLDHGILATSRSVKYRRPRGPYCLRGDCGTCLVRVDGRPNLRACMTPVRDGQQVQPQNRAVDRGPDPTGVFDRLLWRGMDHHHFLVRPRVLNQLMQGVARTLTGLGTLPDEPAAPAQHRHHTPDVLVIGAGAAGRAAHAILTAAGLSVVWVDRLDALGLGLGPDDAHPWTRTGVFGAYAREGVCAAMTDDEPGIVLHTIAPRHLLLATGARTPTLPIVNNDLPGVVSARGLVDVVRRSGARLRAVPLVIGEGPAAARWARALDTEPVAPARVARLVGRGRIEGAVVDGRRRDVQLCALAPASAPADELARQLGVAVHLVGGRFVPRRDAQGRAAAEGAWTVWLAGELADPDGDPIDDASRVARALVAQDRGEVR